MSVANTRTRSRSHTAELLRNPVGELDVVARTLQLLGTLGVIWWGAFCGDIGIAVPK